MTRLLDVLREECALTGTQGRLRRGGVRRLHGADRRRGRQLVPRAGRAGGRRAGRDHRGTAGTSTRCSGRSSPKGGAQCGICTPGMIMAARGARPAAASAEEIRDGAGRQPVPLHRLRGDLRADRRGERRHRDMRAPVVHLRAARAARSLASAGGHARRRAADAARRRHRPVRRLNVGTPPARRFLESVAAGTSCAASARRRTAVLRIGALGDVHRAASHRALVRERAADARRGRARGRRRADPEPRHHRRQHRERLAGRRHAARASPPPTPSSCCVAPGRAPGAVRRPSTPVTARPCARPTS